MKKSFLLLIIMVVATTATMFAQTGVLPRADAANEGVAPEAIKAWVDSLMALEETEIHHLMVVRHGKVVAECHPSPFVASDVHTLYSCSKTITALAIGKLIDDNRLRLDDRLGALLPEAMPDTVSDDLSAVTVRHLLTMAMGIRPTLDYTMHGDDWLKEYLKKPVEEIGRFQYDSMCTFALSAIVQKITGETLLEYVDRNFFTPMEINEVDWEQSPLGINTGGYGLRLQSESMAKIGLLFLRKGEWNGHRLISEEWLDAMSTKHINYKYPGDKPTDTNQGYCYQMWRCLLPGAYRADGAYGQFIIISPERDLVVVVNGMSERTRDELRLTWQELIPGVADNALPDKKHISNADLQKFLSSRQLPVVKGKSSSDAARFLKYRSFSPGENIREYKMMQVEIVDKTHLCLKITDKFGVTASYNLAYNAWSEQQKADVVPPYHNGAMPISLSKIDGLPGRGGDFRVAGNYAWTSPNTLHCRLQWTNWVANQDIIITIDENGTPAVTIDERPR